MVKRWDDRINKRVGPLGSRGQAPDELDSCGVCEQGSVCRLIHHLLGLAQVQHPRFVSRGGSGLLSCDVGLMFAPQESIRDYALPILAAESKPMSSTDMTASQSMPTLLWMKRTSRRQMALNSSIRRRLEVQRWGGARGCPRRWPNAQGRSRALEGAWR